MNFKTHSKRIIVLFILFILSFPPIFAQKNQIDAKGKKQGTWIKYFENSSDIRYEGQFKDDKPIGRFIYYYPSGKVRIIMNHSSNSNRTEAYYYHQNDTLASYGIYRDNKKDSVWQNFLSTGWPMSKETFKNDKLNGERIVYYGPEISEDGKKVYVLRKENYDNGKLNGEFIEYFPDGVIKTKGQYLEGAFEGVIIKNNPNGKIMMKERWKDRQRHGWSVAYDDNGKELGRKYFLRGTELEGEKLETYMKELKEKGINPNN